MGGSVTERPLQGQHAVVTGAGRGIGAAIAGELAGAGAAVTLMGRTRKRLEDYAGELRARYSQEFHAVTMDVTDPAAVTEAFARTRKHTGDPTILVNNAGAVETAPFIKIDLEHWRRMLDVNLTGVFMCCREVLPAMIASAGGRIVNISSTAGLHGGRYVAAYSAAKHGVIGLTRSLAMEMARHGITVNAVCPGYTKTDLVLESATQVAERLGQSVEDVMDKFKRENPHGRFIEPEEVARVVLELCLPDQAGVTGQAVVVDGSDSL